MELNKPNDVLAVRLLNLRAVTVHYRFNPSEEHLPVIRLDQVIVDVAGELGPVAEKELRLWVARKTGARLGDIEVREWEPE